MGRQAVTHVILIALLACCSPFAAKASPSGVPIGACQYFVETGHYVCDEFLLFYDSLDGPALLGQPLCEAFFEDGRGAHVQYFDGARLELRRLADGAEVVQLGELPAELGYVFPRLDPDDIPRFRTAVRRYYADSGHTVSLAFLEFYLAHGGPGTLGLPISEARVEAGRIVQYFERIRLEWRPEAVPRPQVCVSNLGAIALGRAGVPSDALAPLAPPPSALTAGGEPVRSAVRRLRVSASVGAVVVDAAGPQSVHVFVTDQQGLPVEGAAISVDVRYSGGNMMLMPLPTNEMGYTRVDFQIEEAPVGVRVVVEVNALLGELAGHTETFFLPW